MSRNAAGQFVSGHSGNPGGRPAGVSLTARIRKALQEPDNDDPSKTAGDAVVAAMIAAAKSGDVAAFKVLIERADGKIPDLVETTGLEVYQEAAAILKQRQALRLTGGANGSGESA